MLGYLERKLAKHGILQSTGNGIDWHFIGFITDREAFVDIVDDVNMRVVLDPLSDFLIKISPKKNVQNEEPDFWNI